MASDRDARALQMILDLAERRHSADASDTERLIVIAVLAKDALKLAQLESADE